MAYPRPTSLSETKRRKKKSSSKDDLLREIKLQPLLKDLNNKHAIDHAEALVSEIKKAGGPDRLKVWSKKGVGVRIYWPANLGYMSVGHGGEVQKTLGRITTFEETALYPAWRRAWISGYKKYLDKAQQRLDKHDKEIRDLVTKHRSQESISDVYTLIEAVVDGADPSELIEKVSYAYDIRLDQNIQTGPVLKDHFGYFHTREGHSLYEAKKKRLPKAARDLLRSAQGYHPPQIKYISKAQAKYVDELLKRGWVTKTDPGSYQEGVRITKKGEEAYSKDEW